MNSKLHPAFPNCVDTIELFESPGHGRLLGEVTTKQKELYEALGVAPPSLKIPGIQDKKDRHLRQPRLRRSSASRNASSSGQHSLPRVELPGATPTPMSALLVGADAVLR